MKSFWPWPCGSDVMPTTPGSAWTHNISLNWHDNFPRTLRIAACPPRFARAALDLLQEHEPLRFIYDDVEVVDLQHDNNPEVQRGRTWLLAMGNRLVAFTTSDTPQVIWEGDAQVHLDYLKGRIRSDCRLTGGHWLDPTTDTTPTLFLRGTVLGSSQKYFAPLLTFCQKTAPPDQRP